MFKNIKIVKNIKYDINKKPPIIRISMIFFSIEYLLVIKKVLSKS